MGSNYCFLKGKDFMFNLYTTPLTIEDQTLYAETPNKRFVITRGEEAQLRDILDKIFAQAKKGVLFVEY